MAAATILLATPSAQAGRRLPQRPTYRLAQVKIPHSRTVQCDVTHRGRCYHTRGDLDLCSRNVRLFPWVSMKPIQYVLSTNTRNEGDKVILTVNYASHEMGGDHSWFNKCVEHVLYRAPAGYRIASARGPQGRRSWNKYGAHAGKTLLAPSWFARSIGCNHALIYGDQHGNDLYQGYRLMFPLRVDLKPAG